MYGAQETEAYNKMISQKIRCWLTIKKDMVLVNHQERYDVG